MIAREALRTESRVTASPVWLRLVDTFTGRCPAGPIDVRIERQDGGQWRSFAAPHQISPAGDLGFVDLGRGRPGQSGTLVVRVWVTDPATVTEGPTGDPFVQLTIPIWTPAAPPMPTPQDVLFRPAANYRYGAGVPVVAGRAVDANGDPVDRARVEAAETVRGTPVVEQAMTAAAGWFRLPLRWSAGATTITAMRGALSGDVTITVPDDLATTVTVTLT